MLSRGQHGQNGVLDGVQLVRETFDHGFVQSEQVRVLSRVESLLLEVEDQFVGDLMPQSVQREQTSVSKGKSNTEVSVESPLTFP